jgi:AcrR family transcriptional regulator
MAEQSTRERLLVNGAALFAQRGFHGVGIEELGASLGLTGPAIYRHFRTKAALLGSLLISVSQSLLDGAEEVVALQLPLTESLDQLIDRHLEFALGQPDLIKVHERDFANLAEEDSRSVRRLQRRYVEIWVDVLQQLNDESVDTSRTKAHAVFGLLNSTPRIRGSAGETHETLHEIARAALLA